MNRASGSIKSRLAEKLAVDFGAHPCTWCSAMTQADDVQRYLLTLAGTVLEDASAVLLDERAGHPVGDRLGALRVACRDLIAVHRTTLLVARISAAERL